MPVCVTVFVGMLAGFLFMFFTTVFGFMKSSEPFKVAMARAAANPQLQADLGTPIESGTMVSGTINTSGSSSRANLAISISGPKGKATVYVEAEKSAGIWTYKTMEAEVPGQPAKIDLKP